jgi:hypothetical protein
VAASPQGPAEQTANPNAARLFRELETINPDAVTPLEALEILHRWKKIFATGLPGEDSSERDFSGHNPSAQNPLGHSARKPSGLRRQDSRQGEDPPPSLFDGL